MQYRNHYQESSSSKRLCNTFSFVKFQRFMTMQAWVLTIFTVHGVQAVGGRRTEPMNPIDFNLEP